MSIPAEVAAPSKRGPSAFILALLTELSSASPLREEFTLLPLAQAYERPSGRDGKIIVAVKRSACRYR